MTGSKVLDARASATLAHATVGFAAPWIQELRLELAGRPVDD